MLSRATAPFANLRSVSAAFAFFCTFTACAAQADNAAASWPMFRGRQDLTGITTGNLPATLNLLWSFKTCAPVKSTAAIDQNRAFVGSDDGNVYALDTATGKQLWAFKT